MVLCGCSFSPTASMNTSQKLGVRAVPRLMRVTPIQLPTGVRVSLAPSGSVPKLSLWDLRVLKTTTVGSCR